MTAITATPTPASTPPAALARTQVPEPDPAPRRPITAPILSNPAVRLDARTSMVVLEFYNASGDVRAKIPSERELRAYQMGQDPMFPGAPARVESLT